MGFFNLFKTKSYQTVILLFAVFGICACSSSSNDEPEIDEYFEVFIDERYYEGMDNTSAKCMKWRQDNAIYNDGHGTFSEGPEKGYTLHWTRYFKGKESDVKAWCDMVNGFSIYESEYRQDKFNARYYKAKYHKELTYTPVPMK